MKKGIPDQLLRASREIVARQPNIGAFFVYDSGIIEHEVARMRAFVNALTPTRPAVLFSVKSNSNVHLIRELKRWVDGFDVSSHKEFKILTQSLGIRAEDVTVSGPAKTRPFLEDLKKHPPAAVHFDSIPELERALPLTFPAHTEITVRLTFPETTQKLGQDWVKWAPVLRLHGIRLSGLHIYLGRESFSAGLVVDALADLRNAHRQDPDLFVDQPCWNLGLGLTGLEKFTEAEHADLREEFALLPGTFRFELGRSLCSQAATYVSEVLTIKPSEDNRIVILNGGLQHISIPMFSRVKGLDVYSCELLRASAFEKSEFHVYGNYCLAKDIVFPKAYLPEDLHADDYIAFYPAGAYNISASASGFISLDHAGEFMLDQDGEIRDIAPTRHASYIEAFS